MSSQAETKTQLCGNCKKDIPSANFTIHEIHCKRNIEVCTICRETFPKSEMKNHTENEHIQVVCKCHMKMEKCHLEMHQSEECPLRPAQCQYCELELPHNKLSEHEDYCGTRTESCSTCGRNVMVKDLQAHPTVCGQVTEEIQRNSERLLSCYDHRSNDETWFDSQATRNYLGEDYTRPLHRIPRKYQSRFYKNVVQSLEGNGGRRTHTIQVDQNLDYQLARSLQNENPLSHEGQATNRWREFYSKDRSPSKYLPGMDDPCLLNFSIPENNSTQLKSSETMLPCEFCEELIPEEDLILHQSGCNSSTVFSTYSDRNPSPVHLPDYEDRLRTLFGQTSDALYNRFALLSEQLPIETEENIIIPCEFCGIQLEDCDLYEHQDQCDLRPCTAASITRPREAPVLLPKKDNVEKNNPLHPRRVRHQADVTPNIMSRSDSVLAIPSEEVATTRTIQHKPSNNSATREHLDFRATKKNVVGRTATVTNLGKPSSVKPHSIQSTVNHKLENGVQDFPGGPSSRWESDFSAFPTTRNNIAPARRNIRVKQQKSSDGDVEKEE